MVALTAGAALAAGGRVGGGMTEAAVPASALAAQSPTAPSSDTFETFTTTYSDLFDIDEVRSFLHRNGISQSSTTNEIFEYLPRKLTTQLSRSRVVGEIGEEALGGQVVFDIAYMNSDNDITASYLVMMSLTGNITKMIPTEIDGTNYRAAGLKFKSKKEMILALGVGSKLSGPRYLWNWEEDRFTELAGGAKNNVHDIQWAYTADGFWQPGSSGKVMQFDRTSGDTLYDKTVHKTGDSNHVQLLENDTKAIISSRLTNAIVKFDITTGDAEWYCGGTDGTMEIEDFDGTVYGAGSSLWIGQHNAEYFGNDEYFMFDNQYDMTHNTSRLLKVKIQPDKGKNGKATLMWEKVFTTYSPHFGDADQLPTTNVLGCYWPQVVESSWALEYDARIVEVEQTDDADIAWQVSIEGKKCDDTSCSRGGGEGWTMYSAERFYDAPLVYSVECRGNKLSFNTHDIFKSSYPWPGSFKLKDADGTVKFRGTFDFEAHWLKTEVSAHIAEGCPSSGKLVVENRFGDETEKAYV